MRFRLLEPAVLELHDALAWYGARASFLEQQLWDEMEAARRKIEAYPNAWHPMGDGLRRYSLDRFPYGVVYALKLDEIIVVAVAHLHRKPDYWRDRLHEI